MECPKCGSDDLYNRWVSGRKLQRGCRDCTREETPRIPESLLIENRKFIVANQFPGFCYEIYDQYGHAITFSRSYGTAEEARTALLKDLGKWNNNPNYGPCTGVLWPDKVEVVGEIVQEGRCDDEM
jgi:hypothetical protein